MRKLLAVCAVALALGAFAEDKLGFTKKVLITRGDLCALTLAATWQNEGWGLDGPSRYAFKYDPGTDNVFVIVTQEALQIIDTTKAVAELRSRGLTTEDAMQAIESQRAKLPEMQRSTADLTLKGAQQSFMQAQMRTNNVCVRRPVFVFRFKGSEADYARLESGQLTFPPLPDPRDGME